MYKSYVKELAFKDLDLLKKVTDFVMKFYPRSWAKYDEAKPGSIKPTPPQFRVKELVYDYNLMRNMIFGDIPSFDEILVVIKELQNEINYNMQSN